jgi:predicted DCC family thiol-disulfide oxidoreductase YuxK
MARVGQAQGQSLLLYDGVCGLCNGLNRFVIARDTANTFDFASLQSPMGRSLLVRFGVSPDVLTTLYVIVDHRSETPVLLAKSKAVLFIARSLGWPWKGFAAFRIFPAALLDFAYDIVARHRYRLFGRSDQCEIPSPDVRRRFLDV